MIHYTVKKDESIIFIEGNTIKLFKKESNKWVESSLDSSDSITTSDHVIFLHDGHIVISSRHECPIGVIVYSNNNPYEYMSKLEKDERIR